MGRTLYYLAIAGMVLFVGLAMFPSMHTQLNSLSTTGYSYLLSAGITALPYILLLIIIYIVVKASRGGN
jgi:hypothetical protein